MVINADDYYGKEAYVKVHDYLIQEQPDDGILHICMAGFRLGNTLSDNGSVTRGVCHIEEGALTGVTETHNIFKTADGAEARNDDKVEKLDVKKPCFHEYVGADTGIYGYTGKGICRFSF